MDAQPRLSPAVAPSEPHGGLVRALGLPAAIAIVVGSVIGAGIFGKPGEIAGYVGDFRLVMLAWILGGVFCVLGGLCFAELATMLPRAGGLYVYLREAYGRPVAFLFAWCEVLFVRPASIGALSVFFVKSLSAVTQISFTPGGTAAVAIAAIATLAGVNAVGVAWGGLMQTLTTLIKVGSIGLLALVPILAYLAVGQLLEPSNFATTIQPAQATLSAQFGAALLAVMWAYNSWHVITPVAEEIRQPQTNLPRALFLGIGILVVLYLGVNIALHGVLAMHEMAHEKEQATHLMVTRIAGPAGGWLLAMVITVSVFGSINGSLLHAPRVAFAVGRDHPPVAALARVHPTFRTPLVSIVLLAAMASLLVVVSAVVVTYVERFKDRGIFGLLTDYAIFSASIFYCLGVLAVMVLRWRRPEWERPYRTWGFPLVPLLFLAGYAWFLAQVFLDRPWESQVGLLLIGLGLPVFWLLERSAGRQKAAATLATALPGDTLLASHELPGEISS